MWTNLDIHATCHTVHSDGRLQSGRAIPHYLLATVGILSFLIGGCNKPPAPSPPSVARSQPAKPLSAPPEVTSESEDGFHDLVFYVQKHEKLPDGSQTIRAAGTHKGRPLGFEVVLGPAWQSRPVSKDIPLVMHQGTVAYRAVGAESDAFVQVLDEVYGTKLKPNAMRPETRFTAISLGGDPRDLNKEPVRLKLFFESKEPDDYAEFYTNIDLAGHRLEVREKDEDYRSQMVKALRAN